MVKIDEKQAYSTHYNYISCLSSLSSDLKLKSGIAFRNAGMPFVDVKKNLIALTKKSLSDERKIVEEDKDYSYASTSWLPIKTYYLIFNVLLTTEYLFKLQKQSFNNSHTKEIKEFSRKLRDGEIEFSEPIFNEVFDKSIFRFRVNPGANLSARTNDKDMYKMVIRKIAKYKEEDWKRKNKITSLRNEADQTKHKEFLENFEVSIFDFPYYMRIRANYRDFAFIENVDINDTANYFNTYFSFTVRFVKAIELLNKQIINQRQAN